MFCILKLSCIFDVSNKQTTVMTTAAHTILKQLGGNKFIAMIGATCFINNNGQTLVVKFKGSPIANIMYVTLNGYDLYDVKICKYRGTDIKVVHEVENAYCDMITTIFTKTTKLYTRL